MGDVLSQAEIEALFGASQGEPAAVELPSEAAESGSSETSVELTPEQKDILGEVGNINMGTSATTLFALLGQNVNITTPKVSIQNWSKLVEGQARPSVGVRVDYIEGIEGSNILVLKERDVKIITSLMMGGDGVSDVDGELNEIDLSAIGEAMNQMVGSASTSLSSLIDMRIDIDTPRAFVLEASSESSFLDVPFSEQDVVCISFRMEIGTLVDSEIMQVIPYKFALDIVDIMHGQTELAGKVAAPAPPPVEMPKREAPPVQAQPVPAPKPQEIYAPVSTVTNVNVQPAQFQSFDVAAVMQQKENIGIIMDVPLEVTVELGRTSKKIKEILEFTPGSIIELDKLAGEPIDILVNGKFVAKGEVVVIDDNFGIKITDIINAENRI